MANSADITNQLTSYFRQISTQTTEPADVHSLIAQICHSIIGDAKPNGKKDVKIPELLLPKQRKHNAMEVEMDRFLAKKYKLLKW